MPQSLRADCAYPAASRILLFVREKRWSRAMYVLPCMRVCVRDHIHTFDRFKKDLNCLEEDKKERETKDCTTAPPEKESTPPSTLYGVPFEIRIIATSVLYGSPRYDERGDE